MKKLFDTLRNIVNHQRPHQREAVQLAALEQFDRRMDVLTQYAEQAMDYEETLTTHQERLERELDTLREVMEQCIERGEDRHALEYLRLLVRLRPQRDLVVQELNAFHAVADALIMRVNNLVAHLDEAREYARDAHLSANATLYLDASMERLTRYFMMLQRVSAARRQTLPQRLMEKMTTVIDNRKLDLELATYILARRRALGAGPSQ